MARRKARAEETATETSETTTETTENSGNGQATEATTRKPRGPRKTLLQEHQEKVANLQPRIDSKREQIAKLQADLEMLELEASTSQSFIDKWNARHPAPVVEETPLFAGEA